MIKKASTLPSYDGGDTGYVYITMNMCLHLRWTSSTCMLCIVNIPQCDWPHHHHEEVVWMSQAHGSDLAFTSLLVTCLGNKMVITIRDLRLTWRAGIPLVHDFLFIASCFCFNSLAVYAHSSRWCLTCSFWCHLILLVQVFERILPGVVQHACSTPTAIRLQCTKNIALDDSREEPWILESYSTA